MAKYDGLLPKHPKWDQNLKFTPDDDEHPHPFEL